MRKDGAVNNSSASMMQTQEGLGQGNTDESTNKTHLMVTFLTRMILHMFGEEN